LSTIPPAPGEPNAVVRGRLPSPVPRMPHTRSAAGAPYDPHQAIFPILKEMADGRMRLVGTGFFITAYGHFVTAKHVIMDAVSEDLTQVLAPMHALHFVEGSAVLVRHINAVSYHLTADVAVGKMGYYVMNDTGLPLRNAVPRFTARIPRVGSRVVTFAYPESDRDFGRVAAGYPPAAFRANYYEGEYVRHSETPRDSRLVAWPHHQTSVTVLAGASGGPVFDEDGRVFGINCVGGIEGVSYMGRVIELLDLNVPEYPLAGVHGRHPLVRELAAAGHILLDRE
jgi:S1-C subfamily serine protease